MSKDEEVNGPRVAARILEHMEPENRSRVVKRIQQQAPTLLAVIEQNLGSINELMQFSIQKREKIIQRVDHKDLVLCLRDAKQEVRSSLLEAASEKRREIIEYDINTIPVEPEDTIRLATKRVVDVIKEIDALPEGVALNPKNLWA
jgi:flagellar motor switch protein FliG